MVDLREDGEQTRRAWQATEGAHVPLKLAAAWTFHEAYGAARDVMPHSQYDDALDLIAAALSRLVPIYSCDKRTGRPVSLRLNLATGRFRNGATAYESKHGRKARTALMVRREHLPAATDLIRATGIPFFLAETER